MKIALLLLVLVSPVLSACAMQEGDFPSLAKRPIENNEAVVEAPVSAVRPMSALPADLQRRVDAAVSQSSSAHAKFMRNLPATKRKAAAGRGAAVSSETWVVAQMDLAALEIGRNDSVSALADLDGLYIRQLDTEFGSGPVGAARLIGMQRDKVQAQVDLQQSEIDRMKAALR